MALLVMILRKMAQNLWLVISLFLGILISVALVGSMPIYKEATLSRMLVKDLQTAQQKSGVYQGAVWSRVSFDAQTTAQRGQIIAELDTFVKKEGAPAFGLPVVDIVRESNTERFNVYRQGLPEKERKNASRSGRFTSLEGLGQHIRLKDGVLPSPEVKDGVYEALVTEAALNNFRSVLGVVLEVGDAKLNRKILIKPVGIIEPLREDDPYYRDPSFESLSQSFIVDERLFDREFVKAGVVPVFTAGWYVALDYAKLEVSGIGRFQAAAKQIQSTANSRVALFRNEFSFPAEKTIERYKARAKQVQKLVWSLNMPVLIMLGFYMFMVSNLIAGRQKNEIAVLRSRGASRWQILLSFAVESLLLSGLALAAGPPIGLLLTKLLGASGGFLSFVQRASLPVRLTAEAYRYGACAAAVSFLMLMISVGLATRANIVGHKQQLARQGKTPLWHKLCLDLVALALAIYGLYTFRSRLQDLQRLGLGADDLRIDPLQFIVPALFILGGGLLLLRLYPYLLRLIYIAGRKWWSPSVYYTLIQVGRSNSQYQFLMVFLILTIATGLFGASAARTINENTADRIRYSAGSDIVVTSQWPNDKPPPPAPGSPASEQAPATMGSSIVHYLEPSFDPYTKLPDVEQAAKVFRKSVGFSAASDGEAASSSGKATLIGVDTDDFGRAAWFKNSLLAHPFYEYLNLIAGDAKAVLVSTSLAAQMKVKPGDTIWIGWDNVQQAPFTVYGTVDYFPTFNPLPPAGSVTAGEEAAQANAPMLIVGHLSRIQFQLGLEPYEVWLKMKPGFESAELYQALEDSPIAVTSVRNAQTELIEAKNDPFLLALNGILTLGFILSILVSFVGFMLYWVLSLRSRALQNGVMRALGLSVRQMAGMLAVEQLLTSGVAVLIGVVVGNLAARLYVPHFQIAFNPSTLVPPFEVIFARLDYIRLYSTVFFMLAVGLGILGFMLTRIRIHQALKLGED
ncbi:ABC transporter permease [Cohnella hashimotonis]|uniref:ABC transporter permease n=1 Tax=Cohnella hashimotonis TaxID=2826895 RepID=A0ABT6TUX6_9BACL|nr:ABC transporter permease [Cohnella hashimotonis]MDI4650003.1 ABC transporter permease [Cohnella hashimotonis]